jgi:cell division transport system permease protein
MKPRGLRSSISHVRRHPWLHAVSIATITAALLLLGGFFLCYRNLEALADKTNPHVTGTLYLKESLPAARIKTLCEQILSMESVAQVAYKNKASVVEELQTFLGAKDTDLGSGSELFPDLIEIELAKDVSPETVAALKAHLSQMSEFAEVDFSEDWLAQYKRVIAVVKLIGVLLMVGIVVGSSFIIANFMGLRHQARRDEIEIVRLMGAHPGFVLTPFLLEGVS